MLFRGFLARLPMQLRPKKTTINISPGPNLRAKVARGSVAITRKTQPISPPITELVRPMPMARPPSPRFAIG